MYEVGVAVAFVGGTYGGIYVVGVAYVVGTIYVVGVTYIVGIGVNVGVGAEEIESVLTQVDEGGFQLNRVVNPHVAEHSAITYPATAEPEHTDE
jgi:hypothetical protein